GNVKPGAPQNHLNGAMTEELGWTEALANGEVGVQGPIPITAIGPDYITYNPVADEITVWDAKYSANGRFPTSAFPSSKITGSGPWVPYVKTAVANYSGPYAARIQAALAAGKIVGKYF